LEQNVWSPVGDRIDYFKAAAGGLPANPMIDIDSGHQYKAGPTDYYTTYAQMVDVELARPAMAVVQATCSRIGNHLRFMVRVQNLSGVTLSYANKTKVHVIVYEKTHVLHTNRYVRAEADKVVDPELKNGAAGSYTIDTADLTGVNWDRLSAVALVDYQPGSSGSFDLLNAAAVEIGATEYPVYLPGAWR
jgi:hypothetical protein